MTTETDAAQRIWAEMLTTPALAFLPPEKTAVEYARRLLEWERERGRAEPATLAKEWFAAVADNGSQRTEKSWKRLLDAGDALGNLYSAPPPAPAAQEKAEQREPIGYISNHHFRWLMEASGEADASGFIYSSKNESHAIPLYAAPPPAPAAQERAEPVAEIVDNGHGGLELVWLQLDKRWNHAGDKLYAAPPLTPEPDTQDMVSVPREPVAWHVVDKEGQFAHNGFSYEHSQDLVTCADYDWPSNGPHSSIPLYASPVFAAAPPIAQVTRVGYSHPKVDFVCAEKNIPPHERLSILQRGESHASQYDDGELLARLDARARDRDPVSTDAAAELRKQDEQLEAAKTANKFAANAGLVLSDRLEAERNAHKQTSRQANEAIETANASCADAEAALAKVFEKCEIIGSMLADNDDITKTEYQAWGNELRALQAAVQPDRTHE